MSLLAGDNRRRSELLGRLEPMERLHIEVVDEDTLNARTLSRMPSIGRSRRSSDTCRVSTAPAWSCDGTNAARRATSSFAR